MDVIVDELRAQRVAEKRIVLQREHRLAQRLRQQRGLRLIGRVRRRPGIEPAIDAIQARENLRGHVEIRIGRGLADPVFQPGRGIAGAAEHADHDAAVVAPPDRAVRRQRIGTIALVAVDGRRREHRRGAGMLQQPCQIATAERAQRLAIVFRHEGILAALRATRSIDAGAIRTRTDSAVLAGT